MGKSTRATVVDGKLCSSLKHPKRYLWCQGSDLLHTKCDTARHDCIAYYNTKPKALWSAVTAAPLCPVRQLILPRVPAKAM